MQRLSTFLLLIALFLETKPNIFKDFFYKKEKVKLTSGNYLVCEDKAEIKTNSDSTQNSSDDKEEELTFSYYEAKNKETGTTSNSPQFQSLYDNNTLKQFNAITNPHSSIPSGGTYNTFHRKAKVTLALSSFFDAVEINNSNTPKVTRIINNGQRHTLYKLEKDIDASESVLNKTRVALTIFGTLLIGYFAQGYTKSGTTAN